MFCIVSKKVGCISCYLRKDDKAAKKRDSLFYKCRDKKKNKKEEIKSREKRVSFIYH